MDSISSGITINFSLRAREEQVPPRGIPLQADRDLAFADVFVRLQNPQTQVVRLTLEKIDICNIPSNQLQDFSFSAQPVELKPLENSELVFHLSNKTGYTGGHQVKAVLTYRVSDQRYMIESDAVDVGY